MSGQHSINTVRETFESSFDKTRFVPFIKNLLNKYEDAPITRTGQYIPDAYSDYVSKYERIGKYEDSEEKRIDILIVYLKKEASIERARSMQRNFIAGYLKGNYGSNSYKDAALVAFVAPNGGDWRFSLVKLEVKLDADDVGKMKLIDEFTPAKRWSFLVGSHEKSHTAQRQFQPILEDIENNPTLEDLETAFNIEKVTDEFFREYRRLFIEVKSALDKAVKANPKTKADFESKGIDTVNLAKKLMGQIIFLYYLQKKGWFGVPKDGKWGEGSKNFLRELFEKKHGDYEDFFNDVLEPLFYDALRMDRSDEDYYYKRFKCKIPFLNGGLFDPMGNYNWEKTVINLSNSLFSNKTKGNPEGDGILDVFDLYNFTVNEDEPFEKEVAIDPELLGKAYEKFNAIRPDNYDEFVKALNSGKKGDESKFNKQYGVYYTPREIVHYMCQQSLINYLATELEDTVSKDDLATLIQQGENLREHEARAESNPSKKYQPIISEEIRDHAMMVDNKLAAIKVCDPAVGSGAFPVGMMSEIVRTRDVLKTWTKSKKTVYDFKRQCIENSLYGVDIDAGAVEIAKLRLWLSLIVDEDDVQNIKPLPNLDYKVVQGNSLIGVEKNLFNVNLFVELESLKPLYFNATNPTKKREYQKKIDSLIEQITNGHSQFDFEIYFSEVFHEHNGFDVVIGNPPWGADLSDADSRILSKRFPVVPTKTKDSYFYFISQSIQLLCEKGFLAFITPNTWLLINNAQEFRKYILSFKLAEIIDYGDGIFEQATVESANLLMEKQKDSKALCHAVRIKKGSVVVEHWADKKNWLQSDGSRIVIELNDEKQKILSKLKGKSEFFEESCKIIWGIKPYQVGYGIPPQTQEILDKRVYHSNIKKGEKWKPLLVGANVNRYSIKFPGDQFIKYGEWLMYPSNENLMQGAKILIRQTSDVLRCGYDDDGYYCQNSVFIVHSKTINLKYLLGLLNSNLLGFVYKMGNPQSNKVFAEIKPSVIKRLPILKINQNKQNEVSLYNQIVKLVDRILAAKGGNPQADTSPLEREIDQLVYELYGLTEDEVRIVEGKDK